MYFGVETFFQELNAAKERMLASVRADRADREAQVQEKEAELLRIQTTLTDLRVMLYSQFSYD